MSHTASCGRRAQTPKSAQVFFHDSTLPWQFPENKLCEHGPSSLMTGCPAGLPLSAGVRGQETAASGLEGALPAWGWGEGGFRDTDGA